MEGTSVRPVSLQQGSGVDPGLLEILGKKASALYLDRGVALTDAIIKVASDEAATGRQFTTEHVRRIVEFANNSTHQALFAKKADQTMAFVLAKPEKVLHGLRDGAMHKVPVPSARDAVEAAMPKVADLTNYFPGVDSVNLEDCFPAAAQADGYRQHNPLGTLERVQDKLATLQDDVLAKQSSLEMLEDNTLQDVLGHVKQALLYGLTLKDVDMALTDATGNTKLAQRVCTAAHEMMKEDLEYVLFDQTVKTASGSVQMNHPLIQAFERLEKVSHARKIANRAVQIVQEEKGRVGKALRDRLRSA